MTSVLHIGIGGHWTAMEFARLLHLAVRFYRLEQLALLARTGRPDLFGGRFDAVVLKYLAAFDWIAASLMSGEFNESYIRSEELVAELGVTDLSIHGIDYASPGHVAFAGTGPVIEAMFATFHEVLEIGRPGSAVEHDDQGRLSALEALYARNVKAKAALMQDADYAEAELHAIISPSLEDLQFLSNAMTLGKIVAVELRAPA